MSLPGSAGPAGRRYLAIMARREEPQRWRDVRTGLALLAGLSAAALLVFFTDEIRRAVEEGPHLIVETEESRALVVGATVWVAGKPAGRVVEVTFQDPGREAAGPVVIDAVLTHEGADAMRADATVRIRHSSLLAPMVLAVDPGSPGSPPYDFSDTLRRVAPTLDEEAARALADSLGGLLESARPLAERLRVAMREGPGTLASLRRDTAVTASLEAASERLEALADERGSLQLLARDGARLARSAAASLARVETALDSMGAGGAAGRSLDALDRAGERLSALDAALERGEGSLGRFLHDSALVRQQALFQARRDSVMSELLSNPFRWLRFRLF